MLEVRDPVSPGRHPEIAHVPTRLAQHVADRVLKSILALDEANDRELRAVGRPVRLPDVLEYLPGRSAAQRHASQRTSEQSVVEVTCPCEHGQLSRRGHREELCAAQSERLGLGILGADGKDLGRVALACRAVHDRLAVRSEGGPEDRRRPVAQLPEGHLPAPAIARTQREEY